MPVRLDRGPPSIQTRDAARRATSFPFRKADADEAAAWEGCMERRLTEAQCWALFNRLFPDGLAGATLLRELAPEGWERSPLLRVYHPTLEQLYEESVRIHANIQSLLPTRGKPREDPPPSREEVRSSYREEPVCPGEECADLLGRCLWDIFSDGYEVFTHEGFLVDLGSFRASAAFIADFCNRVVGPEGTALGAKDYMDFYMGTAVVGHRADLTQCTR